MALITKVGQLFKFTVVFFLIFAYVCQAGFYWTFYKNPWEIRKKTSRLLQKYSRLALKVFGIHLDIHEHSPYHQPGLFVGNHLSYMDILIFSSVVPTCFVTSVEIKNTPFLGHLCRIAGCLFVERRSRNGLSQEVAEISEALKQGLNVVVYPEATSTDGSSVLRFKRPLYQAAIDAQVPVNPFCLNYLEVNGELVTVTNRDNVFWYGDMEFAPHLWQFCGYRKIDVTLDFAEGIGHTQVYTPTELAELSHERVSRLFFPMIGSYSDTLPGLSPNVVPL